MTFDAFVQRRIFDPLGMKDTHFYLPESKAERFAVVYSAKEAGGFVKKGEHGAVLISQEDGVFVAPAYPRSRNTAVAASRTRRRVRRACASRRLDR